MSRYVAFLRGVSPTNARMPALQACFEAAGFADVRTLLSSGNVVFSARAAAPDRLACRAEQAMQAELGRSFGTFVRAAVHLQEMVESDPFAGFSLAPAAKRIVVFLRRPAELPLSLPIHRGDASVLAVQGTEAYCAYVPGPRGTVLMSLLERTFGKQITTRTLDTVRRCAWA